MVWTHNGRTINIGTAWVSDDNKKYPRQWNNLTDAEYFEPLISTSSSSVI